MDLSAIDPLIGIGVAASTAVTDAVYVFFNAAVSERRRVAAASWSLSYVLWQTSELKNAPCVASGIVATFWRS